MNSSKHRRNPAKTLLFFWDENKDFAEMRRHFNSMSGGSDDGCASSLYTSSFFPLPPGKVLNGGPQNLVMNMMTQV